jgi:hypothetical protein
MKAITGLLMITFILHSLLIAGQIVGNKAFDKYYQRMGIQSPSGLSTKKVFYFTSTFPFSIGRIENADEWELNPAFSVGNGGVFVCGKSTLNAANARIIEPVFSFGIAADVGLKQEKDQLKTTFNGNLMIGFHTVNMMMGYDFLNKTNYFGLALRVDLVSFSPNSLYIFSERERKKFK